MSQPESINEPSVMRMAHPRRYMAAMGLDGFDSFYKALPPVTSKFLLDMFSGGMSLPQIQGSLLIDPRGEVLRGLMDQANSTPSATGSGGSAPVFAALRQDYAPAPYFLVDDGLLELLEHTDISDEVPVGHLHMPFPRVFIEFGRRREGLPGVPNVQTGMHVLESAYLELADDEDLGKHLSVLFIGSPVGHLNAGDDATLNVALPMEDLTMSLHEATSTAFNFMLNDSLSDGHNESPAQWVEAVQALMRVLVKVLLYIGLPDVRREVHNDRTELLEQMRRLKSPGKRAKLQRKLSKTSDYVVIKAPPVDVSKSDSNGNGTRTVKSHWRRGHLRMQRHGHQLTLSKTVFIAPVLVGMGDAQPAASYVVR